MGAFNLITRSRSALLALVMGVGLAACGGPEDHVEITKSMSRSPYRSPVRVGATSQERFAPDRGIMPAVSTASSADGPFHSTTPPTWEEVAPTDMRMVNLRFGPQGEGECYISVLPGGGGGLSENASRWRSQFDQPPYSSEEIAGLATVSVLEQDALLVDIEGTFKGMGTEPPKEGYRLVGALLEYEGDGVFIKMIGPAALVASERVNFEGFLKSIHTPESHTDTGVIAPEQTLTSADGVSSRDGFHWKAPGSWRSAGDRAMRLVTYTMGGDDSTECYVTVLSGTGGGLKLNLSRWYGQFGVGELSDAEFAALPTIEVLGERTPLLEVSGTFTGMSGVAQARQALLGVARIFEDRSVFIKMVGSEAEVSTQKAAFIAFCESFHKG